MARIVVQRAASASVSVAGEPIASMGAGLVVLLGIERHDDLAAVDRLADKLATIRLFEDAEGKMNLSTADVAGTILVVSQFTLLADVSKGRRPSFGRSAPPEAALSLYEHFVDRLRIHELRVQTGQFGAHMVVALQNDGPVTLVIDSEGL